MEELQPFVKRMEKEQQSPTFFELGTALAILHFRYRRVDLVILEVGLGGRLDSTNVCHPLMSLITNISFDHMALLGNTIQEIAREKAGIIKLGRPVVSMATLPDAVEVISQVAKEKRAPLDLIGRDFRYQFEGDRVTVTTRQKIWSEMKLNLRGEHQAANAAGVIATVERLRSLGFWISEEAVRKGLQEVRWPARVEVVRRDPLVILDCAHNVASMQALIKTLQESFAIRGRKSIILAISNDKQVEEILRILAPCFDHFFLTNYGNNPRCMPPEVLAEVLRKIDPRRSWSIHSTSLLAWQTAVDSTAKDGVIVITGSVFLAGEMQQTLRL